VKLRVSCDRLKPEPYEVAWNLGAGQKPCNPGFALRKTWVTGFLSCTKAWNKSGGAYTPPL